jgi:hypothetical protein
MRWWVVAAVVAMLAAAAPAAAHGHPAPAHGTIAAAVDLADVRPAYGACTAVTCPPPWVCALFRPCLTDAPPPDIRVIVNPDGTALVTLMAPSTPCPWGAVVEVCHDPAWVKSSWWQWSDAEGYWDCSGPDSWGACNPGSESWY